MTQPRRLVSLCGVIRRSQECLLDPDYCEEWEARDKAFMLGELLRCLRHVRNKPELIGEFFDLWVDEGFEEWRREQKGATNGTD